MLRRLLPVTAAMILSLPAPALALEDSAEITAAIKAAVILPANRQFSVAVNGDEAQIATYLDSSSTDIVRDCKIDAIELGRTIFNNNPGIVRVIVDFFSVPRRKTFHQVAITKPEIVAFGSGQVKASELLDAIKFEEKVDRRAAEAEEKDERLEHEKFVKNREKAKAALKQAEAKGEKPERQWTAFRAEGKNGVTLAFDYPAVWIISKEQEDETVVRFKSPQSLTNFDATLEVKLYREPSKLPVLDEARNHVLQHMRYPGHRIMQRSGALKFGKGNAFTGVTESFSYLKSGAPLWERRVYFGWPGYVYMARCSCRPDDYNHVNAVYEQMLSTMRLESSASAKK